MVESCGNGMCINYFEDVGYGIKHTPRFKDEESAYSFQKKLDALWHLWDWHAINDGAESDYLYFIDYNTTTSEFVVNRGRLLHTQPFLPYFNSGEVAEKCILECKEYLKVLFDVKTK